MVREIGDRTHRPRRVAENGVPILPDSSGSFQNCNVPARGGKTTRVMVAAIHPLTPTV
jgi:hypothetical protein